MENIPFFRRTWSAARYVVACVLRGLSWCLMYTIILPLGTMAVSASFKPSFASLSCFRY